MTSSRSWRVPHNMKLKQTRKPVTWIVCAIQAQERFRSLAWCNLLIVAAALLLPAQPIAAEGLYFARYRLEVAGAQATWIVESNSRLSDSQVLELEGADYNIQLEILPSEKQDYKINLRVGPRCERPCSDEPIYATRLEGDFESVLSFESEQVGDLKVAAELAVSDKASEPSQYSNVN